MEHDLNPNLLRSWVARHQKIQAQIEHDRVARSPAVSDGVTIDIPNTSPAFVPIASISALSPALPPAPSPLAKSMALSLHVRLSNGVEFDLGEASVDELATVIQMLGRLPCSGSTKG
ncbi:hypothetical protein I6H08_38550 (plasmid) [Burkholderia gladioli]|nr:hypothetical protein I6H08_38550 [Burkholderia gladioli]